MVLEVYKFENIQYSHPTVTESGSGRGTSIDTKPNLPTYQRQVTYWYTTKWHNLFAKRIST